MKEEKRFKVLGINDDEDFCEVCGKIELKKVVWLEDLQTGETFHAGTTCASKKLKVKVSEIKSGITNYIKKQKRQAEKEIRLTPEYLELKKQQEYMASFSIDEKSPSERFAYLAPYKEALDIVKSDVLKKYEITTN